MHCFWQRATNRYYEAYTTNPIKCTEFHFVEPISRFRDILFAIEAIICGSLGHCTSLQFASGCIRHQWPLFESNVREGATTPRETDIEGRLLFAACTFASEPRSASGSTSVCARLLAAVQLKEVAALPHYSKHWQWQL